MIGPMPGTLTSRLQPASWCARAVISPDKCSMRSSRDCEIPGIVERAARIGIFGDADKLEDGQCRHGMLSAGPIIRDLRLRPHLRSLETETPSTPQRSSVR